MYRFDTITLAETATRQDNGFIYDTPVLTRSGVFTYKNPDGTVRREYRPPEEVFSAVHMASLVGKPITDDHNGLARADSNYIIGSCVGSGIDERPNLRGPIVIHHPAKLGARRELSLGYKIGRLDETPGTTPEGERYDAVQRDLSIDHLAVVHRGRAGNARLRMDADDAASMPFEQEETEPMSDPVTPRLPLVRLDSGLEYQAAPEVARELERLRQDAAAARDATKAEKTRADGLAAERDTLKADAAKHDAALKQAREDGIKGARARAELESAAREHGVEVRQDMSDRQVREAVVTKLAPDEYKFDGTEDVYVQVAYDSATARAAKAKANGAASAAVVNHALAGTRMDSAAPAAGGAITSSAAYRRLVANG